MQCGTDDRPSAGIDNKKMMNKLTAIKNMGFTTPWKLINIGLHGADEIPVALTRDEVTDYLDGSLTEVNEQTDDIISLLCETDNETKFNALLDQLANRDPSDPMIQKRKWRAYMLKTLIDNISTDPLQAIIELMEFWVSMGIPDDCPQPFPDEGDKTAIQEYFTEASAEYLLNRNRLWLKEEIASIKNAEDGTIAARRLSR